jgi:predicted secreted protein
MKNTLIRLIVFFSCVMCFCNVYAEKNAQDIKNNAEKLVFTDPQKPIVVSKSSPIITVKLKSNPTTGYSWYLTKYDSMLIEPLSGSYIRPVSQLAGAPGYILWKFKVKPAAFTVPVITRISLIYARPWDLTDATSNQLVVVTENH